MSQARGSVGRTAEDSDVTGGSIGPQGSEGRTGSSARPGDGDLAGIASGMAGDIAGAAVAQGRQLLETARGQATSFADERKNSAAQSISDLAGSLRDTGKTFEDRPNIASFVGSAADGLEQLAGGIRDRSFADLYGEVETYARRQPVTVAAVALVAGFLAARFIKSSADELSEANAARRSGAGGRGSRGSGSRRPVSSDA